jgi:hypothetical protein
MIATQVNHKPNSIRIAFLIYIIMGCLLNTFMACIQIPRGYKFQIPTRQFYQPIEFHDNSYLKLNVDSVTGAVTIDYGSSHGFLDEECSLCRKGKTIVPYSYLDCEVIRKFIVGTLKCDLKEFVDIASAENMIPIIKLCTECKLNVQIQLSVGNIVRFDDIADSHRETFDLMSESAYEETTDTPNYGTFTLDKIMFTVQLNRFFYATIKRLSSTYYFRNGILGFDIVICVSIRYRKWEFGLQYQIYLWEINHEGQFHQ